MSSLPEITHRSAGKSPSEIKKPRAPFTYSNAGTAVEFNTISRGLNSRDMDIHVVDQSTETSTSSLPSNQYRSSGSKPFVGNNWNTEDVLALTSENMILFDRQPLDEIRSEYSNYSTPVPKIDPKILRSEEAVAPFSDSSSEGNRTTCKPTPYRNSDSPSAKSTEDLEFEMEHTFLGVTCFNEFIEVLTMDSDGMTTKPNIAKAFILLAAKEAAYMDAATSPHVTAITTDMIHLWDSRRFQQLVKLGKVSMREFLNKITFEVDDTTTDWRVFEAFKEAAAEDKMWHQAAQNGNVADFAGRYGRSAHSSRSRSSQKPRSEL